MKRIIAILLVISLGLGLSACTKIDNPGKLSTNFDDSKLTYNGRTYIECRNTNGKYKADWDEIVLVATLPYGFFYILGAVSSFYGNDVDNPDFILSRRTGSLYLREDITIDHSAVLSVCKTEEPFCFCISDVTTGNVIAEELDEQLIFDELCYFSVEFVEYHDMLLHITISECDGKLYLQDAYNSDYYEITEAFAEDIYRFGIDKIDERLRSTKD